MERINNTRFNWRSMLTVILIVAPLVYVGGYFWAGKAHMTDVSGPLKTIKVRTFRAKWQATIYQPVATLEKLFTGTRVLLDTD